MTNSGHSRREVLGRIGIAAGASVFGIPAMSGNVAADHADRVDRGRRTILEGTDYETEVYTIESPNEGRTVFVSGGIHGNERGGIEAAHLATEYTINRGTLVVVPEANEVAVERDHNHGPNGDLNRQFPIGSEPTTTAARGIWEAFVDADPDLLIDMHNATGIYGIDGIGQSIFPTVGRLDEAERAVAAVNDTYIADAGAALDYEFHVGPTISERYPLLIHKAAADLNVGGWLTEVTRSGLTVSERTFLHDVMTRELLEQVGIGVTSEPAISNSL